mgnify:CR=1 FL=1
MLTVLFLGDIVGEPGRNAVIGRLPQLKEKHGIGFHHRQRRERGRRPRDYGQNHDRAFARRRFSRHDWRPYLGPKRYRRISSISNRVCCAH